MVAVYVCLNNRVSRLHHGIVILFNMSLQAIKGKHRGVVHALQLRRKSTRRAFDQAKKRGDEASQAAYLRELVVARLSLELLQQWEAAHPAVLCVQSRTPRKHQRHRKQPSAPADPADQDAAETTGSASGVGAIACMPLKEDVDLVVSQPLASLCDFLAQWGALPSMLDTDKQSVPRAVSGMQARIRAVLLDETRTEIAMLQQCIAGTEAPDVREKVC